MVDLDIMSFFDEIPHELLMEKVRERITDGKVLTLIRGWLTAGVMEDDQFHETVVGSPQGGVISSLLANLYLNHFDWGMKEKGSAVVRYADDAVILCKTKVHAEEAYQKLARKGLIDVMDQFTRNTDTRLRTDIFVVNNGEGKELLNINSPFNQFSAIVAVDQDRYCRLGDTALRDVLIDVGRDGIRPSMPMVEISPKNKQEKDKIFDVRSVAIFNKNLQMVGEVSGRESLELFWVKGVLKNQFVTEVIEEGSISLYESNLKQTIRTQFDGTKLKAESRRNNKEDADSVRAGRVRNRRRISQRTSLSMERASE